MRPTIPRATAEQIERYIKRREDLKEIVSQRTPKQQELLHTKHPGRSARDYMDCKQTNEYLANLKAQERLSEQSRNVCMSLGRNPLQELRRALGSDL